jgi:predicted lipoprotein
MLGQTAGAPFGLLTPSPATSARPRGRIAPIHYFQGSNMAQRTIRTGAAPKAPAPARRGLYFGIAAAAVALAGIMLDTKIVHIGSKADMRQQAFSPDDYGQQEFPRIAEFIKTRAADATELAAALAAGSTAAIAKYGTPSTTGAIMSVRVAGTAGEPKAGIYPLAVEGMPEGVTIRVQTGPAINGTELRDAPGDIAFGSFKNQIEYQNAGAGINRAMKAAVLDPIDTSRLAGRRVEITGAFRMINPRNWLITPVEVGIK